MFALLSRAKAMMHHHRSKVRESAARGFKPLNYELKSTFSLYKLIFLGVYYNNETLRQVGECT